MILVVVAVVDDVVVVGGGGGRVGVVIDYANHVVVIFLVVCQLSVFMFCLCSSNACFLLI